MCFTKISNFSFIREQTEWILLSNKIIPGEILVILDLEPATWYDLRVTAHNSAGFTDAEYEFATLTATGRKYIVACC